MSESKNKGAGVGGKRGCWAAAVGLLAAGVTILLIVDVWLARDTDLLDDLFYSLFGHEYPAMLIILVFPALGLAGFAVGAWLARRVGRGRSSGPRLTIGLGLALLLFLALVPVFGRAELQEAFEESRRAAQLPRTGPELLEQYGTGKREFLHATLAGADLRQAHLSGADLSGADLSEADLAAADLSGIDLSRANLVGADLSGADLRDASLVYADLSGALLRDAYLVGTRLGQANLSGADLSGARVTAAQLAQAASLQGATLPNGTIHE